MGFQRTDIQRNAYENNILNLEKRYYELILEVIQSPDFKQDLLLIEKEIKDNYPEYRDIWDLKNKIKVPAERLTRHHIYIQWHNIIRGIYPSPVSSDLGIKTNDAVICIDLKTIDTHGNSGDISSTAVENNQTSFDNRNYPYIPTTSNLKSIDHYSRLPVLTYVIKIIYTDNGYSFNLSREDYPTIVVACIPNGEISKLFDYNIIENFKTYNYYSQRDGDYYISIPIPAGLTNSEQDQYVENYCLLESDRDYTKVQIGSKPAYLDLATRILWWKTSERNTKVIRPVKSGGSVRFSNEILKNRYDSSNRPWLGYKEFTLEPPLL
jgi:hypothetical protein